MSAPLLLQHLPWGIRREFPQNTRFHLGEIKDLCYQKPKPVGTTRMGCSVESPTLGRGGSQEPRGLQGDRSALGLVGAGVSR